MCPTQEERATLRRILKRADYATSDMEATDGERHLAEIEVIRRIEGATIPTVNYPASRRQRLNPDVAAVAAWENEGGSIRKSKRKYAGIA